MSTMLNIHTERSVRLMTIERPTAWIVVAFLVETCGTETTVVSGPRIVKVIQKNNRALPCGLSAQAGRKGCSTLALPASLSETKVIETPIKSPYVSILFGFTNADVVIGLAARPPTRV